MIGRQERRAIFALSIQEASSCLMQAAGPHRNRPANTQRTGVLRNRPMGQFPRRWFRDRHRARLAQALLRCQRNPLEPLAKHPGVHAHANPEMFRHFEETARNHRSLIFRP